jgi:hypothetical protein
MDASNPSSFGHTQVLKKQLNNQKFHVENIKPARNRELQVAKEAINFFPQKNQNRNKSKTAQTSNMYYYTSDTSENDASGADVKADESSRIIKSKQQEKLESYVLFQN